MDTYVHVSCHLSRPCYDDYMVVLVGYNLAVRIDPTCREEHLNAAVSHVPDHGSVPYHGTRELVPCRLSMFRTTDDIEATGGGGVA